MLEGELMEKIPCRICGYRFELEQKCFARPGPWLIRMWVPTLWIRYLTCYDKEQVLSSQSCARSSDIP